MSTRPGGLLNLDKILLESMCHDESKSHTKSCEYIGVIIYHDELYIVSTTPQEILHMLQDKYKINIYLESNSPYDPGGRDNCQIKEYL